MPPPKDPKKYEEYCKNRTGDKNPFHNKKHTEESIRKIGESSKERFKDKKNHPMFGKVPANFRKDITKEMLHQRYIIEKKSLRKIAKELNMDASTVCDRLKKYRIQRRTLSESHLGNKLSEETRKKLSEANSGENNPMHGKPPWNKDLTKEVDERLRKISEANSGKNNFMYGKSPTWHKFKYRGVEFKSGWEVEYAKFFDARGIKWEYEHKRFNLGNYTYTPDFYFPDYDCYLEVKGWYCPKSKKRCRLFKKLNPNVNWYMVRGITDTHKDVVLSYLNLFDKTDNRIGNLICIPRDYHTKLHMELEKREKAKEEKQNGK